MMARPSQDPQRRINEILDAAEPLFLEKGYHNTAISDIAQKMGVAQGTLYYYFKSKEEVLEALLKRYIAKFISEIESLVYSGSIAPPRKFELVIQTIFYTVQSKEEGLLLRSLYDERTLHLVDKIGRQAEQIIAPLLQKIIEEGVQQQYFRISHLRATVNLILAIIQSLVDVVYEKSDDDIVACQFKLAEELVERALGAQIGTIHIFTNA